MTPSLNLSVKAHGHTVDDVGDNEDGWLVPGDHCVGNCKDQDDDAHEVAKAIPRSNLQNKSCLRYLLSLDTF